MSDRNEGMPSGQGAEWSDEGPPAPAAAKPFFNFWRCCGCLALVGTGMVIAFLIGAKWLRDRVFETVPLEVPVVAIEPAEADAIADRLGKQIAAGELVKISPRDLTIAIQRAFEVEGNLGPETRFHAAATPEKLLDLRLRLQFPDEGEFPWFMRGRFINVSLVGTLTIEDGQITDAKLESYRFAGLYQGVKISEADSKEIMKQLREQSEVDKNMKASIDRVKVFRFDGEMIELQLEPE